MVWLVNSWFVLIVMWEFGCMIGDDGYWLFLVLVGIGDGV